MLICSKCGKIKPENEFYKDSRYKSGYRGQCKECLRAFSRMRTSKWRKTHRKRYKQHYRNWYKKHRKQIQKYLRKYQREHYRGEYYNPKVRHARYLAQKLEIGTSCELCPDNDKRRMNLERHHPDYDYPEIFVTVCSECHSWIHKECVP